jgi:hypothetical protein
MAVSGSENCAHLIHHTMVFSDHNAQFACSGTDASSQRSFSSIDKVASINCQALQTTAYIVYLGVYNTIVVPEKINQSVSQ